ncbi:hypothetical protein ACXZ65_31910 [Streptomyces aculeolatus]
MEDLVMVTVEFVDRYRKASMTGEGLTLSTYDRGHLREFHPR